MSTLISTEPLDLTPAEAAPILRHSLFTVRRWCQDGTLGSRKLGRKILIARAEVDRLLRDGTGKKPGPRTGQKTGPKRRAH